MFVNYPVAYFIANLQSYNVRDAIEVAKAIYPVAKHS